MCNFIYATIAYVIKCKLSQTHISYSSKFRHHYLCSKKFFIFVQTSIIIPGKYLFITEQSCGLHKVDIDTVVIFLTLIWEKRFIKIHLLFKKISSYSLVVMLSMIFSPAQTETARYYINFIWTLSNESRYRWTGWRFLRCEVLSLFNIHCNGV